MAVAKKAKPSISGRKLLMGVLEERETAVDAKTQLKDLEKCCRIHQRLLTIAKSDDDCALHEAVIHLSSNPRFHEAVVEVVEQPEMVRTLALNPRVFADDRGIYIPSEVEVVFARKGETWFIGFRSSTGTLWGYEGGEGGRGFVKGEDESDGDGDGEGNGDQGGGQTPA